MYGRDGYYITQKLHSIGPCEFKNGKAIGGFAIPINDVSDINACYEKVNNISGANALSWFEDTKECTAQFFATGEQNPDSNWITCIFRGN